MGKDSDSLSNISQCTEKIVKPSDYFHIMGKGFYLIKIDFTKRNTQYRKIFPIDRKDIEYYLGYYKKWWNKIPKYEGIKFEPYESPQINDVINIKDKDGIVHCYYNQYTPVSYSHRMRKGHCKRIIVFLQHIFGKEHLLQIFEYLYVLIWRPKQVLPIVCLVSEERMTGKTTFLNLLKEMMGADKVIVGGKSVLESKFTSPLAGTIVYGCDEAEVSKETFEKCKLLSTAETMMCEAKGKDAYSVANYLKLIFASNNLNFVQIDSNETRCWVFEVPSFGEGHSEKEMNMMFDEIPEFLYFLCNWGGKNVGEPRSRMHFRADEIETEALKYIKKDTKEEQVSKVIGKIIDENKTMIDLFVSYNSLVECDVRLGEIGSTDMSDIMKALGYKRLLNKKGEGLSKRCTFYYEERKIKAHGKVWILKQKKQK